MCGKVLCMGENWREVSGYPGLYEVSDKGRVRSVERTVTRSNGRTHRVRSKILAQSDLPKGHRKITLRREGTPRTHLVHRLVLEAFVGPAPIGTQCRHLNDIPSDNSLANLAWGLSSENQLDAVKNGKHYLASLTECKRGHSFNSENLVLTKAGRRVCRACRREHDASRREGRPFNSEAADARYQDILAGIHRHKSGAQIRSQRAGTAGGVHPG